MTVTSPSTLSTRVPSPLSVRAAAVLLPLLVAVNLTGTVMFGFVWSDDPVGPGLVFAAVVLAAAATAVAALPSLLRGERTGWLLTTAWALAYTYWSVYKVFGELEYESAPLLAAGAVLSGLLLTPSARRALDAR